MLRVSGQRFAVVGTLPTASTNAGIVLEQGNKLWFSDGTSWVDLGATSSGAVWGSITGTLSSQTDLQTALNAKQAASNTIVLDQNYIAGFAHRTTASTIIVSAGYASVPGYLSGGTPTTFTQVAYAGGTITPGSLSNNTTYYAYLKLDGTIVLDTTAPVIYNSGPGLLEIVVGGACARFLFAIRNKTIGTSGIVLQSSDAGDNSVNVTFLHNVGISSRLISAGGSTTAANASAVSYAPPTVTKSLKVKVQNSAATAGAQVRPYVYTGAAFIIFSSVTFSSQETFDIPCDATPQIQYDVTTSGVANIDLFGYNFSR